MLATNLDFGEATDEGYVVPNGPCLDPSKLLEECRKEGIQTGVGLYFIQEAARHKVLSQTVVYEVDSAPLIDPMEKLSKIERPITANDLVESLQLTPVEVELIQTMTIGQRDNPLTAIQPSARGSLQISDSVTHACTQRYVRSRLS